MHEGEARSEKPNDARRKYLSPDEARRVVEAAGKVGRQGERDRLLLTLIYRHGLRVSEAVDLRWSDFDLEAPKARTLHVRRLKGSKDSIHTLEPDTARLLKRMERESDVTVSRWPRFLVWGSDLAGVILTNARGAGCRFGGSGGQRCGRGHRPDRPAD
jgi:integrase